MELSTKTVDLVLIVSVNEDQIDAAVAIEFKNAMRAQTLDRPKIVVLDLSTVNFIDSSRSRPLLPQCSIWDKIEHWLWQG